MQAIRGNVGVVGNPGLLEYIRGLEPPKKICFDVQFTYFNNKDPDYLKKIREKKSLFDVVIVGPVDRIAVRRVCPDLPQVTLFPSLVDIMSAVKKAAALDRRVCILSPFDLEEFHRVEDVFRNDWTVSHFLYTEKNPLSEQLSHVRKKHFSSVVGGFGVCHYAKEHGLTPYLYYDKDTLQHSIAEAVKIVGIKNAQNEINENLRRIMDVSDVGLLAVNADGIINYTNQITLDLLGADMNKVLGKKLFSVFPVLEEFEPRGEAGVFHFNAQELLCDTVILSNGQTVYRFKDVVRVEKASHEVRKKILNGKMQAKYCFNDIVGEGIQGAIALAKSYAMSSDANILIAGPTGTGKELFASSIHNSSSRANENFIAINCAALPENLLESELFGYESGAFTGARKQGKRGLMELAHKGTLFLDEVTEIPYALQAKLLRVLQEKEVLHVGGEELLPVDIRVIAATNRRLEDEIRANRFRADLFYRLATLVLEIPPLSKRRGDIVYLMDYFLRVRSMSSVYKNAVKNTIFTFYENYDWPGNVRELMNVLERCVTFVNHYGAAGISTGDLTRRLLDMMSDNGTPLSAACGDASVQDAGRALSTQEISEAVSACGGNKSLAAKKLGVSRSTVWRRLKSHGGDIR